MLVTKGQHPPARTGACLATPRSPPNQQLARAVVAARMFVAEAALAYLARPRALSGRIRTASDVDQFIRSYRPTIASEEQELFVAIAVNAKHSITRVIEVAKGTLASVDVHPREAFRELIVNAAAAVFFVHNHPSGDTCSRGPHPRPPHGSAAHAACCRLP